MTQGPPENQQNVPLELSRKNSDGYAGIFAIIALLLLLGGWMWLKSNSLMAATQRFSVMFHDVAGLNTNAAVNVNGVRVGVVEKMKLKRKDEVSVDLKVNGDDIVIPEGSKFRIMTNGVIGAKYVEIILPQPIEGQKLPALNQQSVVEGEDPVRVEVVINKVATELSDFDFRNSQKRLNRHMDQFAKAADKVTLLADKLTPAASRAVDVEQKFGDLATEMRGTSKKLDKILDNPMLASDLKETAQKAKETAEIVSSAIKSLNKTLGDKPLREELMSAMDKLNQSTIRVQQSVETVQHITDNKELRSDAKEILADVNQTMDKANHLLSKPGFGSDVRGTLTEVRQTVGHLDLAARQINQILDKKHPLVHLIFGRPGSIKNANANQNKPEEDSAMVVKGETAVKDGTKDATAVTDDTQSKQ